MKAILFVILNVSVCFPRGSVGVEILIPGGFGGRTKKFPRLAIARHDPPPLQHTFNFYPDGERSQLHLRFRAEPGRQTLILLHFELKNYRAIGDSQQATTYFNCTDMYLQLQKFI